MSIQFFTVKKTDRRIVGWQRSGKGTTTPADTAEKEYIVATDADLDQYRSLQSQAAAESRTAVITHTAGVIALEADTRPIFRIVADKSEVDLSVPETVSLTATRIDDVGDTMTGFNASGNMDFITGNDAGIVKLNFTAGVAVKVLTPKKSGVLDFTSNNRFKLENPLSITVVE